MGTGPIAACVRAWLGKGIVAGAMWWCCLATVHGQDVSRYDVVWTSPSADADGSMPLGNGDISVNAWVEPRGDVVFYIGKTDSWGEHGRLLKVGKVRVSLDPPLPVSVASFEQRLDLRNGVMLVHATSDAAGEANADTVDLRLWVDANLPVVRVEVASTTPRTATAAVEIWRTSREAIPEATVSDTFEDPNRPQHLRRAVFVGPDELFAASGSASGAASGSASGATLADRVGWYHHAKEKSDYADLVVIQGLTEAFAGRPDPLLNRVFGAVVTAPSGERVDATHLRSPRALRHRFDVHVRTEHPSSPAAWLEAIEAQIAQTERVSGADAWTAHRQWWNAFWQRSWIDVSSDRDALPRIVPDNRYDVRVGIDQHGGNPFVGEIGRVTVLPGAVSPETVARWAAGPREEAIGVPVGDALAEDLSAPVRTLPVPADGTFAGGLSVEAWIRPDSLPAGGGRIVDRVTPGASDGWLLDTYPGHSLRFIVGATIVHADRVLPEGRWSHVAAVVDPADGAGTIALYLDGERVAGETLSDSGVTGNDAFVVSRAYALQRFIDACAGRGRYPIKFNGSIFTVPNAGSWGDADYRRWGPGYWWQNTRLPYLSMCASGDFEMLEPLFRMYVDDHTPINLFRTRQYTGHGGLFIPECVSFWGSTFASTYGWTPFAERGDDKLQESPWHKWEWVSGLELAWMMLDCYDHTQDQRFVRERVLPFATEVLRFFDEQYGTNAAGELVMEPSQALETWWDTTNPMPEVAGLQAVSVRLLALPAGLVEPEQREVWARIAAKVSELPTCERDGVAMLAPAARFERKSNVENPELYAVFPFRRVSFEKPNAALGVAALEHRWDRGAAGWRQDDLFMTHLGLAEQARTNLVARARNKHAGSRFPAFWGPNYDWIPDQDHGGVLMRTLQTMLMQTEGRKIFLLPAWPKEWSASFKLHAPYRTVVSGRVEKGELVGWSVDPPERAGDVVVVGR